MAESIKFYKGSSEKILNRPLESGSIYFSTTSGELFIDSFNNSGRIERFLIGKESVIDLGNVSIEEQTTTISGKNIAYINTSDKDNPIIKIGDGSAYIIDLPAYEPNKMLNHINDTTVHITPAEREKWNNKVSCFLNSNNTEELIFLKG